MIRSASGYGSGRRRTALTMLKIAVFAPIPRASVTIATAAKPGFLRNCRSASRKLFITKRGDGIDACGAARGNETGNRGNNCQQPCHGQINRKIKRVYFEENVSQSSRNHASH